jgi:hypothetical protein
MKGLRLLKNPAVHVHDIAHLLFLAGCTFAERERLTTAAMLASYSDKIRHEAELLTAFESEALFGRLESKLNELTPWERASVGKRAAGQSLAEILDLAERESTGNLL